MRLLLLLAFMVACGGAWGQDFQWSEEWRGSEEWYESLRQPKTGMACCSYTDCRVTRAIWQAGQWWARLPENGPLVPIPPDIVLNEKAGEGPNGEAILCSGIGDRLFCFIPEALSF